MYGSRRPMSHSALLRCFEVAERIGAGKKSADCLQFYYHWKTCGPWLHILPWILDTFFLIKDPGSISFQATKFYVSQLYMVNQECLVHIWAADEPKISRTTIFEYFSQSVALKAAAQVYGPWPWAARPDQNFCRVESIDSNTSSWQLRLTNFSVSLFFWGTSPWHYPAENWFLYNGKLWPLLYLADWLEE